MTPARRKYIQCGPVLFCRQTEEGQVKLWQWGEKLKKNIWGLWHHNSSWNILSLSTCTFPFTSCELQTDDSHSFPPWHSAAAVLVSPTTSTGGGSMGWRIKRIMLESLMFFFSLVVVTHWHGSHRTWRSCYSSCFFLPSTTELQLVAYSVFTTDIRLTVNGATIVLSVSTRV